MSNASLSTRDRVQQMHAAGLSVRQIANALHITTQAVYKHLDRIKAEQARAASA